MTDIKELLVEEDAEVENVVHTNDIVVGRTDAMALFNPEQVLLREEATDYELDPSHLIKFFLVHLLSDKLLS